MPTNISPWTQTQQTGASSDFEDVRFGSQADMCVAKSDVRFTPNRDRESRHEPQRWLCPLSRKRRRQPRNPKIKSKEAAMQVRLAALFLLADRPAALIHNNAMKPGQRRRQIAQRSSPAATNNIPLCAAG